MDLNSIDLVVFVCYFFFVAFLGVWAGSKQTSDSAEEYFLAGRTLPWYAVGSSFIGSNISTEHFIGMIGAAYTWGICVAAYEWGNIWTFSMLIWIFIPFLLSSRVFTAPEFLEKRFNGDCRLLLAVMTVLANIAAFLAAVLYAGSVGLNKIFDLQGWLIESCNVDPEGAPFIATVTGVLLIGISAGSYAIFGGLRSVAWTDVFQVAIMIGGGTLVTVLGLLSLGDGNLIDGWHAVVAANSGQDAANLPAQGYAEVIAKKAPELITGGTEYNRMAVFQPNEHKFLPWYNLFVGWLSIGIWYSCINQFMVQRVLAAKDSWHARMGVVFAGFLKILLPFIVIVPGLIMFTMDPNLDKPDQTYPILVRQLIPMGLKGLLLAALFGALQSTIDSVLNSTSTILTLDIYGRFIKPWWKPEGESSAGGSGGGEDGEGEEDSGGPEGARDKAPLNSAPTAGMGRAGKWVSLSILLFSMALAPFIGLMKQGIFEYIQNLYAHFAPPFSAVFLVGLLWKRANGQGASIAIVAGIAASIIIDNSLDGMIGFEFLAPFSTRAIVVWAISIILIVVGSLLTEAPLPEKINDQTTINWKKLNIFDNLGDRWYTNITFWWGLFCLGIVACYFIFSGLF